MKPDIQQHTPCQTEIEVRRIAESIAMPFGKYMLLTFCTASPLVRPIGTVFSLHSWNPDKLFEEDWKKVLESIQRWEHIGTVIQWHDYIRTCYNLSVQKNVAYYLKADHLYQLAHRSITTQRWREALDWAIRKTANDIQYEMSVYERRQLIIELETVWEVAA